MLIFIKSRINHFRNLSNIFINLMHNENITSIEYTFHTFTAIFSIYIPNRMVNAIQNSNITSIDTAKSNKISQFEVTLWTVKLKL